MRVRVGFMYASVPLVDDWGVLVVPGWALESDEHDDNNNRGVGAMMHQSETRQSLAFPVSLIARLDPNQKS